jgi:adenosylhomocysteine nucleosidase
LALRLHDLAVGLSEWKRQSGDDGNHSHDDGVAGGAVEHRRGIVVAFVGMAFEARIAAGPGVLVVCGGAQHDLVAQAANWQGCGGIISFGVAGGLASSLRPGDWIVASSVVESHTRRATDLAWSRRLLEGIPGACHAPIMGVDAPVAETKTKIELHRSTGAAAVDMESHRVARLASAHSLPFTAVRVIVDPLDRTLPPAALIDMAPDGRVNALAILRNILTRPSQIASLARVALDAFVARSEMHRVRQRLGPHFGLVTLPALASEADFAEREPAPVAEELVLPAHLV